MIDRRSREVVSAALQRWMHREISDVELLSLLKEVESEDATVKEIIQEIQVWFPDNTTEKLTLFKHSWNRLNRILLVLASDCHIQSEWFRKVNLPCQIASAVFLAFLVGSYFAFGFSFLFFLVWLACGIVGIVLLTWTIRGSKNVEEDFGPFASEAEMLTVSQRVSNFRIISPPPDMTEYVPPSILRFSLTPFTLTLVICAPLILAVLMFPIIGRGLDSRVVTPS